MKRNLLFAAAMLCGLAANAQEYAIADGAGVGLNSSSVTAISAGTVLASTDNVTMATAFDDSYKMVTVNGPKNADDLSYDVFIFNGTPVTGDYGVQGNANPKDANGGTCSSTFLVPTQGAAYEFTVNKDGYLYVLHKASSNKSYTVFEEGSCLGYTFVMATDQTAKEENGVSKALPQVLSYTLTGDEEYNYLSLSDYPNGIMWPEKIWYGIDGTEEWTWNNYSASGCSVIKFAVWEGLTYIVNANGSKMSALGYYFDTTGDATISVAVDESGTDAITLMENGAAVDAIKAVAVDGEEAANAPIYNLAGQQVTSAYKGVVLKGGKKYINK